MIYPANFEQKIGFDRLREQVAARCTMRAARARLAGETFSTSAREIARRLTLADEMRLLLDMEHEFPGGEYPDVDHIVAKLRVEGSFLDVEEVVTLHRALTVVGAKNNIRRFTPAAAASRPFPKSCSGSTPSSIASAT